MIDDYTRMINRITKMLEEDDGIVYKAVIDSNGLSVKYVDMTDWCFNNLGQPYRGPSAGFKYTKDKWLEFGRKNIHTFYFKYEADATLFKLTWL